MWVMPGMQEVEGGPYGAAELIIVARHLIVGDRPKKRRMQCMMTTSPALLPWIQSLYGCLS